ncbi:hypothetical protein [Streptomyces sp. NBC_01794]|uniref:hypothetical protein n=1 Tax=Streptomyces sp. NBC_01794 TaxID=2975942 RepID=UPI00308E3BDB|nr:hypothetical protein OIE54_01095 [Streptomyces sp. NBC_01794]
MPTLPHVRVLPPQRMLSAGAHGDRSVALAAVEGIAAHQSISFIPKWSGRNRTGSTADPVMKSDRMHSGSAVVPKPRNAMSGAAISASAGCGRDRTP